MVLPNFQVGTEKRCDVPANRWMILPLTIPVLIFGVAASNAAIAGPVPFGTPFTILCALSLASLVIGPVAAAAALRHAD